MLLKAELFDRIYIDYPEEHEIHPFFTLVKEENKHQNPKYFILKRMHKQWIKEPRFLTFWEVCQHRRKRCLAVPRGFKGRLARISKHHHITLQWTDRTICPPLSQAIPEPTLPLDPFQITALEELLAWDNGCLEAPTGAGKTNILLSAIPILQTPTLILVHTIELLKQTKKRCKEWLGVDTGTYGDGQHDIQPITVAMIQTLSRLDLRRSDFARYFGAVLVDECHHSPAMTWAGILNELPARYKFGFTATAWRKDQLEFVIWKVIGKIRWKVSRQEVVDAGRIMLPKIEWQETEFDFPNSDLAEWQDIVGLLVLNEQRNKLIETTVRQRLKEKTRGLILTDRIAHARKLAELLSDLRPALLVGDMDVDSRKVSMMRIRDGVPLTIATVHLLGEGIDVPGWDLLFLVSPFGAGPRVLQAIGRIVRTASKKESATMIDFVDLLVPKLARAALGRKNLYKKK